MALCALYHLWTSLRLYWRVALCLSRMRCLPAHHYPSPFPHCYLTMCSGWFINTARDVARSALLVQRRNTFRRVRRRAARTTICALPAYLPPYATVSAARATFFAHCLRRATLLYCTTPPRACVRRACVCGHCATSGSSFCCCARSCVASRRVCGMTFSRTRFITLTLFVYTRLFIARISLRAARRSLLFPAFFPVWFLLLPADDNGAVLPPTYPLPPMPDMILPLFMDNHLILSPPNFSSPSLPTYLDSWFNLTIYGNRTLYITTAPIPHYLHWILFAFAAPAGRLDDYWDAGTGVCTAATHLAWCGRYYLLRPHLPANLRHRLPTTTHFRPFQHGGQEERRHSTGALLSRR